MNVITSEAVAVYASVFLHHLHHLQRCDVNIYRFILMNIHFPIYIYYEGEISEHNTF